MFDFLYIQYATVIINRHMEYAQPVSRGAAMFWRLNGYAGLQKLPFFVRVQSANYGTKIRRRLFFFDRGNKVDVAADAFSEEVLDLIQEHGGDNKRLAVDKIMLHGLRALDGKKGFEIAERRKLQKNLPPVEGRTKFLLCVVLL